MKSILISLLVFAGALASAATVTCNDEDGKLRAKVNTREDGTARLILSNPSIGEGNKTIAVFPKATVEDDVELVVVAKVDFRNKNLRRGEYIGSTRLGELKEIRLYVEDLGEDEGLVGSLRLVKRNEDAEDVYVSMICK